MSTPPEIPASATKAGPKPPKRRARPGGGTSSDGPTADQATSEGPATIASATDTPAPPRRGRRGAGASAGAVAAAAASAAEAPVADPPKSTTSTTTDTPKTGRAPGTDA